MSKYQVLYHQRVEDDIDDVLSYYCKIDNQLALDFLDRIEEAKQKIVNMPEGFELRFRSVRSVLLQQFNYHIYYTLDGTAIIILAILHAHSGPGKIQEIT